jgi:copper chaperone CopZ
MDSSNTESFLYEFHVGMTCEGCSNAINKLMSSEKYVTSYELSVPEQWLKVVGADGIDQQVMARLTKWATASKKTLEFKSKTPLAQKAV